MKPVDAAKLRILFAIGKFDENTAKAYVEVQGVAPIMIEI
jgi:hypothetical protein